jgi:hypothetical protein
MPTKPISPLATAAAVVSDAAASRSRRTRAGRMPSDAASAAEGEHVEQPRAQEHHDRGHRGVQQVVHTSRQPLMFRPPSIQV